MYATQVHVKLKTLSYQCLLIQQCFSSHDHITGRQLSKDTILSLISILLDI